MRASSHFGLASFVWLVLGFAWMIAFDEFVLALICFAANTASAGAHFILKELERR